MIWRVAIAMSCFEPSNEYYARVHSGADTRAVFRNTEGTKIFLPRKHCYLREGYAQLTLSTKTSLTQTTLDSFSFTF